MTLSERVCIGCVSQKPTGCDWLLLVVSSLTGADIQNSRIPCLAYMRYGVMYKYDSQVLRRTAAVFVTSSELLTSKFSGFPSVTGLSLSQASDSGNSFPCTFVHCAA